MNYIYQYFYVIYQLKKLLIYIIQLQNAELINIAVIYPVDNETW